MRNYSPMVETYIQDMKPDAELGEVPSGDTYFLGRLDLSRGITTASFLPDRGGWFHRLFGPLTAMKYNATGWRCQACGSLRGLDSEGNLITLCSAAPGWPPS